MPNTDRRPLITTRDPREPPRDGRRALVTGGAGFIGTHLVERLIHLGFAVGVVDDLSAGHSERVPAAATLHTVDVADSELAAVFEAERPNVVFHLAAQASVTRSMDDPSADVRTNVVGGVNVLEQCRRFGVRHVVYASTGGALYGVPEALPCPETHPVHPLSVYGASKYALEQYIRALGPAAPFSHTILRFGNVYGPGQNPHGEAGVCAIFARRMLANEDVVIYGDGRQERDFVYVSDAVDALIKAADADGVTDTAYNIASGEPTSVNDVFRLLAAETAYTKEPRHAPARPGEVDRIYLDISRAASGLRWAPRVSIGEGIRHTVDAMRTPRQAVP